MSADATLALWKVLTIGQNLERIGKGTLYVHTRIIADARDLPMRTYTFSGPRREGSLVPTSAVFVPTSLNTIIAGYKLPYVAQFDVATVSWREVEMDRENCEGRSRSRPSRSNR